MELRISTQTSLPLIAVIGQGSYQTLMEAIALGGWTKSQFQIVANIVEPFDAEHLAPILAQAFRNLVVADPGANSVPWNVVLLQGGKTNNDAQIWQSWLAASLSNRGATPSVIVTAVLAYENRENTNYAEAMAKTMPRNWCKSDNAVYFSSSTAVRSFSSALFRSSGNTFNDAPIALTIHPKISQEVRLHLGWKVVEIPVGPQALLHWMSQNSSQL